ncbi:MAG TPA: FeoA family protein [Chthonomonadaceae bacterium]|nr:FeoA family protein [Chthonomonadaceae bacterium]
MSSHRKHHKPRKTFALFARPKRKEGESDSAGERFAQQAQAALDAAPRSPTAPASPHGALYRRGVTLADLRPGECGFVHHLLGTPQRRLRLLEMGLTVGTHVQVLRIAAFGGPLDVEVRGYQLSLRREEAAIVWLDDPEEVGE